MDQDTIRNVLKFVGPVVGFMVWQANGMSGKGFVLGIAAGLLSVLIAGAFIGIFATN